jgi:alkylmercury lyase
VATRQEKKERDGVSIQAMAAAISSAMPVMDATEQQIAIEIYRQLAEGRPVTTEAIAQAVGIPAGRVEAALNSWPGVFRDGEGRVAGFWGLAIAKLEPEYSLQIDGKTSFAWCALDTLFIPPLMDKTVGVHATDPETGEQVSLVVDRDGVRELTPPGAVVSMVIPDGPFGYDVIESFCHQVLFFASEVSGRSWVAKHEGTTLLTVDEAFELGRFAPERVYRDVFGGPSK